MRFRIALLGSQALCLGLTAAFLVVAATSVFLSTYGSELLPYAYIAVAFAGVAVSSLMTAAQRHLSLALVAEIVTGLMATALTLAWIVLAIVGQTWVTFPLVVLFFVWIPVGFVLIGTQSGRLLDVQQLKAYFARIAAGFSAGFLVGGLLSARLVSVLGSPEGLLLVDAAIALVFLGLVVLTARRHPAELRQPPERSVSSPVATGPSLRGLLSNRLVVVLLGYQLLSAAATQLLDFLVWQGATTRFTDPAALARFLGVFGAIINGVGLVFVFTVAGFLMSRYGVGFGLAANPVGVLVLVVVTTTVGAVSGQATTVFFVLLCAQQVVDIALTDGTTRGSINAAYQALAPAERFAAQARVEAVGVPAAVGSVGVLLLAFQWLHAGVTAVLVVVLVLSTGWLALAFTAYRLYGTSLRRTITRRAWDPTALRLDDAASREVVARLLQSRDDRDVAVALDALCDAAPDDALPHLMTLLTSDDPARRRVAVGAARRHGAAAALPGVLAVARDRALPSAIRAEAVRAGAALGASAADLLPLADDDSGDVRASVAVAVLHLRGSADDEWRVRALLVVDEDTRTGTLVALSELPVEAAVPWLLELAARPHAPAALAEALRAHGESLVPATEVVLDAGSPGPAGVRLVRAVGPVPDRQVEELLLRHLQHPDRATRDAVLRALTLRDQVVHDRADVVRSAVRRCMEDAARTLDALDGLTQNTATEGLRRALRDELRSTAQRCGELLGLLHGPAVVARSVRGLSGAGRPLALETLEVTLGRSDAAHALALLDPEAGDADRRRALAAAVPIDRHVATDWLVDLATDPHEQWREPWLRASALWALSEFPSPIASQVAAALCLDADAAVAETARAVLGA